jgi:hypothetical protein
MKPSLPVEGPAETRFCAMTAPPSVPLYTTSSAVAFAALYAAGTVRR